jgi:hypothetical protein
MKWSKRAIGICMSLRSAFDRCTLNQFATQQKIEIYSPLFLFIHYDQENIQVDAGYEYLLLKYYCRQAGQYSN